MVLSNVHIIDEQLPQDIHIENGMITHINEAGKFPAIPNIHFENAIAFPGLVNSHDHLDFNLFPQLGNRIYNNYAEWAHDIQSRDKAIMNRILKVPLKERIQWGIYKNLLNGVTTVINHGNQLKVDNELICVYQQARSLHSIQFEKNWKLKLNRPGTVPVAIHIGEGTDQSSYEEISSLIKWNILKKEIIGIHGVAMDAEQAKHFKALVWCPASNYFLLNKTAAIKELKKSTVILFGTDSTLTTGWNIWKQLRLAKKLRMLEDKELYESVNSNAANVWKINTGSFSKNKNADVVVAKRKNDLTFIDSFFSINPEDILLVVHNGFIRLFDESIKDQLNEEATSKQFSTITINGAVKNVAGDLPGLEKKIAEYCDGIRFPFYSTT